MLQGVIDVIASDISIVGESDFTANAAVLDVAVNNTGVNGLAFSNPSGRSWFNEGDNLMIQKVWGTVNWGFGQGGPTIVGPHNIGLAYWDGASLGLMPPFPYATRSLNIPVLCSPLDFGAGIYSAMPTTGGRRQVRLANIDLRISQVNLPAALDGQRITVQYFLQVLHNESMELFP